MLLLTELMDKHERLMSYQSIKNEEVIEELKMKHNSELNLNIKKSLETQQQLEKIIQDNENRFFEQMKAKEKEMAELRYLEMTLYEKNEDKLLKRVKLLESKLMESNTSLERLKESSDLQIIQLKNELEKKRPPNLFNKHLPFSRFNSHPRHSSEHHPTNSSNSDPNSNRNSLEHSYDNYPNANNSFLAAENLLNNRDSLRSNVSYDAGDENDRTVHHGKGVACNENLRVSPVTVVQPPTKSSIDLCAVFNIDTDCAIIFDGGSSYDYTD